MNKSNKLLSDIVAFRTYAKYLNHLGRRETLEETINRNMSMHLDRFPKLSKDILKAYKQVHDLKVMPSMRSMQFGGEAILRNNVRMFNCFTPDTEFVTREGLRRFSDFVDGEQVVVLARRGWEKATVKKFGTSNVLKLIVGRGKAVDTVEATSDHRWLVRVSHGSGIKTVVKTTQELVAGDTLVYSHSGNRNPDLKPCPIGIQHGIVYGDGSFDKERQSTRITLCGDSVELSRFFSAGVACEHGANGGAVRKDRKTITALPYFWKELPALSANKEYLLGFLMGWMSADGSIGKNGSSITLDCCDNTALEWARSAFSLLNIFSSKVKTLRELSPFDGTHKPLYRIHINSSDLPKDFFLKDEHSRRFVYGKGYKNWRVKSVVNEGKTSDVWCVQQPTTETFTLSNGIVTKNCSFVHAKYDRVFAEILYLLLCGTGVGYSVQKRHISQLPTIRNPKEENVYQIHDSIEGWADALDALMRAYFYRGIRPVFDYSRIRPKGSYLVTTGAKAPGPEPLKSMLVQVENKLKNCIGRKMTSLEVHDIICVAADCVLAGGIRRAALISLFDFDDNEMLTCKSGSWWDKHPYRARANNSAVLPRKTITKANFKQVYDACIASNAGEPGIFWTNDEEIGTNPCAEISLNSTQFCNLTSTNLTDIKSDKDLHNRVYAAALLGTLQASYTDFPYLSESWKNVTEREALLGCSFTGIADAATGLSATQLKDMAKLTVDVNQTYAKKIGINPAARITAIKPEGSASCVVGSSSGIHARHAEHYLRRVRMNKDDALARYLKSEVPGIVEDDIFSPSGVVVTIPQESPAGAIVRGKETAKSLFNRVMLYYRNWIVPAHVSGVNTHNVSCTINYKPEEVEELFELMWDNRENYAGISLLPYDSGTYQQAPFEDCTKETFDQYDAMVKNIDLTKVIELEDHTDRVAEIACAGGSCEIDFTKKK